MTEVLLNASLKLHLTFNPRCPFLRTDSEAILTY